jgi:tetratricopeptide (TPR) repeat protein
VTYDQAIDLRLGLRNALWPLGEIDRGRVRVREAETLAMVLDDPRRKGWLAVYRAHHAWWTGDHRHAAEWGRQGLAMADAVQELALRVEANFYLGSAYHRLGQYGAAIERLQENAAALSGERAHERFGQSRLPSAAAQVTLSWCRADLGEFPEACAAAEQAVRLAETADDGFNLAMGHYTFGIACTEQGDFGRAIPALERAVTTGQERQLVPFLPFFLGGLGGAYIRAGRIADGVPLLEQADGQLSGQSPPGLSIALIRHGQAYLSIGRRGDATARAQRGLQLARERGECGHEAWGVRLLGEIAASSEPPDVEQAEAHYRESLALANELGMRPLAAHCHLGLGTLYGKIGRPEQARAELTTAADMYRAMEMTFWLARAEAALTA